MLLSLLVILTLQPWRLLCSHKRQRKGIPRHKRVITRSQPVVPNPALTRLGGHSWNRSSPSNYTPSHPDQSNRPLISLKTDARNVSALNVSESARTVQPSLPSNVSRSRLLRPIRISLRPVVVRRDSEEHRKWLAKTPEIQEWARYFHQNDDQERSQSDDSGILCWPWDRPMPSFETQSAVSSPSLQSIRSAGSGSGDVLSPPRRSSREAQLTQGWVSIPSRVVRSPFVPKIPHYFTV